MSNSCDEKYKDTDIKCVRDKDHEGSYQVWEGGVKGTGIRQVTKEEHAAVSENRNESLVWTDED